MGDEFKFDCSQKLHETGRVSSKWPKATSVSNYQNHAEQKLSSAELWFGIMLYSDKMITLEESFAHGLINIFPT